MNPLLIFLAASAAIDLYSTYASTRASDRALSYTNDFYRGSMAENAAYFQEYLRRHHIQNRQIKYPYRTGMIFDQSRIYNSQAGMTRNDMARLAAFGRLSGRMGFYRPAPNYNITKNLYFEAPNRIAIHDYAPYMYG